MENNRNEREKTHVELFTIAQWISSILNRLCWMFELSFCCIYWLWWNLICFFLHMQFERKSEEICLDWLYYLLELSKMIFSGIFWVFVKYSQFLCKFFFSLSFKLESIGNIHVCAAPLPSPSEKKKRKRKSRPYLTL